MERSFDLLISPPPPFDKRLHYGVQASQFGELRLPACAGPHPVVLGIHGGWWRAAYGLDTHAHLCAALTAAGIATWNIEYRRLSEEGGWPNTLVDVGSALDFLREIGPEYNLDLRRVVPVGFSAGGQLALWAAARHLIMSDHPLYCRRPLEVCGAIALAGAVDLVRCSELGLSRHAVREFLDGSPNEVPDRYAVASPIERLPLGIPHTLIHGTADTTVPSEISERYHAQAKRRHDACELILLEDVHHFELVDPRTAAFDVVLQCVRKHLQS